MPIVSMPNGDRVQFPDDMSQDEIKAKIRSKFPEAVDSGWQLAGDELMGLGRGAAKGVARVAESLPTLGVPHVSELDPNAKQFIESPNATYGETVGEFVGENAPSFAVGYPEAGLIKGLTARAAPYVKTPVVDALKTIGAHMTVGGAEGAAQPAKDWKERAENALGGSLTAGVLSPTVAGKVAGVTGAAGAGYLVDELARRFGWGPVIAALGSLGVGASKYGHGSLTDVARRAFNLAEAPVRYVSKKIPATVKGAVGGRAAERAQETYDANQPGPAAGQ